MVLLDKDIIQVDTTVIVGVLILLTLSLTTCSIVNRKWA